MPVRRYRFGKGMTVRRRLRIRPPWGKKELTQLKRSLQGTYSFETTASRIEEYAQELKKAKAEHQPAAGSKRRSRFSPTPKWYAERLLNYLNLVRALVERNEAADAARFGIELGMIAREAADKFYWEAQAMLGVHRREQVRQFARKRGLLRRDDWTRWQTKAEEIRKRDPNTALSKRRLAKLVWQELPYISGKIDTIRKRI